MVVVVPLKHSSEVALEAAEVGQLLRCSSEVVKVVLVVLEQQQSYSFEVVKVAVAVVQKLAEV